MPWKPNRGKWADPRQAQLKGDAGLDDEPVPRYGAWPRRDVDSLPHSHSPHGDDVDGGGGDGGDHGAHEFCGEAHQKRSQ